MSATVPIKIETLKAFGDEARRIGGSGDELSTAEMLDTFGSAEIVKNQDITITANGSYTPESGYTGFGKVTAEIDFPNAEDAFFGTAHQVNEYAITAFAGTRSNGNKITAGYKFTANVDIAVVGLWINAYYSNTTVRLWDDETGEELATYTCTKSGESEVLLPNPVMLKAGKSYVLSTHNTSASYYYSYYPNNFSSTAPATSSKITFVNGYIHFSHINTKPTSASSQYMACANMLIAEVSSDEAPSEYKVQKSSIDGISDEVQRITGLSGTLSLAQIKTALQGIASTA